MHLRKVSWRPPEKCPPTGSAALGPVPPGVWDTLRGVGPRRSPHHPRHPRNPARASGNVNGTAVAHRALRSCPTHRLKLLVTHTVKYWFYLVLATVGIQILATVDHGLVPLSLPLSLLHERGAIQPNSRGIELQPSTRPAILSSE